MTNKYVSKCFSFTFVLESVYFIYCCSIRNTAISLVTHKPSYEQSGEKSRLDQVS